MEATRYIKAVPLFRDLDKEHIEELAFFASELTFKRGQVIFSEGEQARGFYILTKGRVKVFKVSPEGKEQILHILGPGEPLGEVAVFAGERFPAGAEAMEECTILFLPKDAFAGLIKKEPAVALKMLAVLSKRLRRFTMLIEDLSLREVPGRLAAYLLSRHLQAQGDPKMVHLDISKAQLASLLGTIPETLSRILARMVKEGLIELEGLRGIRILDSQGLEELAQGLRRLSSKDEIL